MIQTYIVKTAAGLESVLASELRDIGAAAVRELKRAVAFDGDQRMLYRANYELRTALRVLIPIHTFSAYNEQNLYEGVRQIDWSQYMSVKDTLAVDTIAAGEVFKHSHYVGLLTKDAIVDQFRDRTQRRPDVNTVAPTLRVHVLVQGTRVEIALDASGDSLHRRNYRRDTVEAPLSEVLAAGMVLLSGWNGQGPFVDPMCGSGTIAIEAAMLAVNMPPQHKREGFGFFKWPDFDRKLWESVKGEADAKISPSFEFQIVASDKESRARNATSLNVLTAELEKVIEVEKMTFEKALPPGDIPGTLMTNPPYDERMKVDDSTVFYQEMGDQLKKFWPGWNAWIISSNREALKHVGLRPSRRITLYNGALECSFQKFEMYEGKKFDGPKVEEPI